MPEIGTSTKFTFTVDGLAAIVWVARFEAVEAVSDLFQVALTLTSEEKDIAFADVVGKSALLTLETDGSEPRHIHGIVSRFRRGEEGKKWTRYEITLVPRHFRLRLRHDARIFQEMAVPDIIESVFSTAGLASGVDFRLALSGSYSPREYCVQYRESDFAFVSRLMEEEGIWYFFEHAEDKHVMVLADAPSGATPISGSSSITYRTPLGAMAHGESISTFVSMEEVKPGKVTLSDFNFKKPSLSLLSSTSASLDTDLEVYDYPGEYEVPGYGSTLAKVRLEEWQARRAVADGESGCIRLTPGFTFELSDHPRDTENQEYLLTEVSHKGAQPTMGEAGGSEGPSYRNAFRCIPKSVPFRPERRTARPTIKGVQTAIVTGPGGEEVHTDEHGRVKVQFHWDRQGKKDDKSSCWIRVSQLWAGAGWGAMWIPRIGHEVIVDFIEGDPDRPIIVGRVYHAANVPPYPLPGEKTKSTIKSNTSQGGGGSNELRFEDKAGSEEIYLHGQKDWNIKIENDKNQVIGHDETLDVGNDQTIHIGHDRTKTVDNDQVESIGGNKTIEVAKDHTETIHQNETITVDGNETVTINKSRTHTVILADTETVGISQTSSVGAMWNKSVGGAMTLSVGLKKSESVGGSSTEAVGSNKSVSVGGSADETVAKNKNISVSKKMTLTVSEDLTENIKKNRKVDIGESLQIHCGDVTITIKKDGTITVEGKDIKVKSTGTVKVEAKKLQVKTDGAVDVKASGNVTVKGGQVKLN